ncbi:hypothetical protein HDV00_011734 [Rhizophlyctis rosea]|nr:hypothetical protein HDV00_011734 [Rhizophlyctis rosea]
MFSIKNIVLALASISAVVAAAPKRTSTTTVTPTSTITSTVSPTPTSTHTPPYFDRFFIIVLENEDYTSVMSDPYLGTTLPAKGRLLTNYNAITHPSEPNYVAMIAGNYYGIADDGTYNLNGPIITGTLETAGKTWKTYQEAYPGNCFTGSVSTTYYRKHNPFISFTQISGNSAECAKIVPATQLATDESANAVPQYVFYTPDIKNDGHDTTVAYSSSWLKNFLEPKLTNPVYANTAFFIVYDEGVKANHVYALLVGGAINNLGLAGTQDGTLYNHYSQLATVEKNWNLPPLSPAQADTGATPFSL